MDPSALKYHHAGLRNGFARCQMALWSGPTAPPSPRLPGSCTGSLRWPALGPTLNAPFNVPKRLPGPSGLVGLGRAGVSQGTVPGMSSGVPEGEIHKIRDFRVISDSYQSIIKHYIKPYEALSSIIQHCKALLTHYSSIIKHYKAL